MYQSNINFPWWLLWRLDWRYWLCPHRTALILNCIKVLLWMHPFHISLFLFNIMLSCLHDVACVIDWNSVSRKPNNTQNKSDFPSLRQLRGKNRKPIYSALIWCFLQHELILRALIIKFWRYYPFLIPFISIILSSNELVSKAVTVTPPIAEFLWKKKERKKVISCKSKPQWDTISHLLEKLKSPDK